VEKPTVKLVGEDDNAFSILGRCAGVMREFYGGQGMPQSEIQAKVEEFQAEATNGDYNHLLRTVLKYFKEGEEEEEEDDEYEGEVWEDQEY